MKISARGDYGLRATLALAQRYGEGLVPSKEIAACEGIPESYLDQLLTILSKARLVRSVRGPQGGHALLLPPGKITLDEILTVLEGPVAPGNGVDGEGLCQLASAWAVREVWQEVEQAMHGVLSSITLEDLLRRQRAHEAQTVYYI